MANTWDFGSHNSGSTPDASTISNQNLNNLKFKVMYVKPHPFGYFPTRKQTKNRSHEPFWRTQVVREKYSFVTVTRDDKGAPIEIDGKLLYTRHNVEIVKTIKHYNKPKKSRTLGDMVYESLIKANPNSVTTGLRG